MMTNVETWYNVRESDIDEFEKIDKIYLLKLFEAPRSTPSEALYLELGILPLSVTVKVRRLCYLHNILKSQKQGMLYKVFITQWLYPTTGDWVLQVKKDMKDFQIESDFEWIARKSKESFKNLVKEKAKEYALNKLIGKKSTHSKLEKLDYLDLSLQSYLSNENLSVDEKRTVFLYRTRMAKFGENFKSGKPFTVCPLCQLHYDSQFLALKCPVIKKQIATENISDLQDVYSTHVSTKSAKLLGQISRIRESILKGTLSM